MRYLNIYTSLETDFTHNEHTLIGIISCTVDEEINGIFNLSLEYLIDNVNSNMLVRGNIIKCPVPGKRQDQLFRITGVTKDLKTIKVNAVSIGIADLSVNFIRDTNIVSKNKTQAVKQILANTMQSHNFNAIGDETETIVNNVRIVRYNPIQAIFSTKDDNTVINRYGGEYQWDNFNLHVMNRIGEDNGVTISHRKNLVAIEESIDDSELVTRIIPQGREELLLPEYYIDSPKINDYEKVFHKHLEFDIGVDDNTTEAQALDQLRIATKLVFSEQKVDQIFFNYRINFIELRKITEYKEYAILETVEIGDIVNIQVQRLNLNLVGRVYKYSYNVLKDQYEEIEIGLKKPTVTDFINKSNASVQLLNQKIELGITNLDSKLSSKIEVTENQIMTNVTNADKNLQSQITQNATDITTKVSANDVSSIIKQDSSSVQIGFNGISNNVVISQNGIQINNGGLTITNPNGEVIIDGTSNVFKITRIIEQYINAGNNLNYVVNIPHDLGYIPAYLAYQVDTQGTIGGNTLLPAIGIGGAEVAPGSLAIQSVIRCNADDKNMIISFIRSNTQILSTIKVKIYLFVEKLL